MIGVDSDGTAFDTMERKHKQVYIPQAIRYFGLQSIQEPFTEVAAYINLYSEYRGTNRFPALELTFRMLSQREDVDHHAIPEYTALTAFVTSGLPLANAGLSQFASLHPDPTLDTTLAWSEASNKLVSEQIHGLPPFAGVADSLGEASAFADIHVISATVKNAITRESPRNHIRQSFPLQGVSPASCTLQRRAGNGEGSSRCLVFQSAFRVITHFGLLWYPAERAGRGRRNGEKPNRTEFCSLLHRHALGQVPGFVDVQSFCDAEVVGHQLQRDDG
jgi:hypothetical protein